MQEALKRLPKGIRYSVLADNASWHKSKLIKESDVMRFLFFNEPGQYRLNIIENSFSAIRLDYRSRPETERLLKELEQIGKAFASPRNRERFKGYYRNHLRALMSYLEGDN